MEVNISLRTGFEIRLDIRWFLFKERRVTGRNRSSPNGNLQASRERLVKGGSSASFPPKDKAVMETHKSDRSNTKESRGQGWLGTAPSAIGSKLVASRPQTPACTCQLRSMIAKRRLITRRCSQPTSREVRETSDTCTRINSRKPPTPYTFIPGNN